MRKCRSCQPALAFGVGVLMSMIVPLKWMLIVTLILLIGTAVCETQRIRG